MVADVAFLSTLIKQQQQQQRQQQRNMITPSNSTPLITRDLLGIANSHHDSSTELDLDLHVPSGFEKRLDLKSGKVYLQRCKIPNMTTSSQQKQDLNQPPESAKPITLLDETNLELKLVSSSPSRSSSSPYQSVCTLGKVKSALERLEKETSKKRSISMSMSKSHVSQASNSSSSIKDTKVGDKNDDDDDARSTTSEAYAAGCPNCLLYVLISRRNPICPRCNSFVPSPTLTKKPRIDLNIRL